MEFSKAKGGKSNLIHILTYYQQNTSLGSMQCKLMDYAVNICAIISLFYTGTGGLDIDF